MLIVFGGLPGTGKTTLARELARRLSATYVRIDTLEQAILRSGVVSNAGPSGYFVGYAIAADNVSIGLTVVADSVNSLEVTRDAWRAVAKMTGVRLVEVEVICSDAVEHRRRIETRKPHIPGHTLPKWKDVLDRRYEPWNREHFVIDTATVTVSQAIDDLLQYL
jgi:predicted kinase